MGILLIFLAAVLAGCYSAPAPPKTPVDPTAEAWYPKITQDLAAMAREAESLYRQGSFEKAGDIVTKGQPLLNRLMSAPQPTLDALQAVSDLDDLYARLLVRNKHYSWARTFYQKNVYRWKNWKPQTEDTARRLESAKIGLAECDRHIGE